MREKAINQRISPALAGAPAKDARQELTPLERWGKWSARREQNSKQERYLFKIAKDARTVESRYIALSGAAALHWCNKRQIVEKKGENFTPVGAWNCGKKYCSCCANKKRKKLLGIFTKFFLQSDEGRKMWAEYDLALFTVTLQHSKDGLRSTPYYKELSTHFRNALKYGKFKEFIAGGFYNTEHTYGKNGHHIHRHALVLIPRRFNVREFFPVMEEQLRQQWKSRTGGSFQIDLRPIGYDEKLQCSPTRAQIEHSFGDHLLEITKYITKRSKSDEVIPWQIIEAIEKNNRSKFYGRFGILHNVKELNMNQEKEGVTVTEEESGPRELYIATISVKRVKDKGEISVRKSNVKRTLINGVPANIVTKTPAGKFSTWYKRALSYEVRDLVPIRDEADAFLEFQKQMNTQVFNWKVRKSENLNQGYTVDKWKENREALQRFLNKTNAAEIVQYEIKAPF